MEKMIWPSDILNIYTEYNTNVAYRTGVFEDIKGLLFREIDIEDKELCILTANSELMVKLYLMVSKDSLDTPVMSEEKFKELLLSFSIQIFESVGSIGHLFKKNIDKDTLYSIYTVRLTNMNPFNVLRKEIRDLTYAVRKLEEIVYKVNTQIPNPV